MAKLRIKNSEQVLEVIENEQDLLTVLREAEVYVKSSCGGHASCGDCVIKIVSGEDNLCPPPFDEIKLLGNVFHITKERLACQTKLTGDVTIDLSGHNESSDQQKLKNKKHNVRTARVRKSSEVKEILEERKALSEEKTKLRDSKDDDYFEHWKKKKEDPNDPLTRPRKLDGGNRPMPFISPEPEEEIVPNESADTEKSDKSS